MQRRLAAGQRTFRKPLPAPFRLLVDSPIPLLWSEYRRLYADTPGDAGRSCGSVESRLRG